MFELATPARIVFGSGAVSELGTVARTFASRRALLVTGREPARATAARLALEAAGLAVTVFPVPQEPTLQLVREGVDVAVAERAEVVVACGGGSALDAGKAIAILATNGGEPIDFLEVIGRAQALRAPGLPMIAVPTTAGTGSEVTRNAVLASPEVRVKASLRSPLMLPKVALVDPDLIDGVPPAVLAASGLDALSQLIEPFLSVRAQPITDALAREGLRRSARSLRLAFTHGLDPQRREDLALASLCGGLCLANAGLGAVHGFAAPLGGTFDAPHGAVCATLLPHVLAVNGRALASRAPAHPARAKLDELGPLLLGRAAPLDEVVAWVHELVTTLAIPSLARYGMKREQVGDLVAKAKAASSMRANPLPLTDDELAEILTAAL